MSTKKKSEDNPYQLVNNVARRAKVLITHEEHQLASSQYSAIHEALREETPKRPRRR